jgi:hypothetical protein
LQKVRRRAFEGQVILAQDFCGAREALNKPGIEFLH